MLSTALLAALICLFEATYSFSCFRSLSKRNKLPCQLQISVDLTITGSSTLSSPRFDSRQMVNWEYRVSQGIQSAAVHLRDRSWPTPGL